MVCNFRLAGGVCVSKASLYLYLYTIIFNYTYFTFLVDLQRNVDTRPFIMIHGSYTTPKLESDFLT